MADFVAAVGGKNFFKLFCNEERLEQYAKQARHQCDHHYMNGKAFSIDSKVHATVNPPLLGNFSIFIGQIINVTQYCLL